MLHLLLHLLQTARKGTAPLLVVIVRDIRILSFGLKGIQQEHVVQSIMESVCLNESTCLSSIFTCVSMNLPIFTYVDIIKYLLLKRTFLRYHRHLVTVITTCVLRTH